MFTCLSQLIYWSHLNKMTPKMAILELAVSNLAVCAHYPSWQTPGIINT